jgi:hypothetical protein
MRTIEEEVARIAPTERMLDQFKSTWPSRSRKAVAKRCCGYIYDAGEAQCINRCCSNGGILCLMCANQRNGNASVPIELYLETCTAKKARYTRLSDHEWCTNALCARSDNGQRGFVAPDSRNGNIARHDDCGLLCRNLRCRLS